MAMFVNSDQLEPFDSLPGLDCVSSAFAFSNSFPSMWFWLRSFMSIWCRWSASWKVEESLDKYKLRSFVNIYLHAFLINLKQWAACWVIVRAFQELSVDNKNCINIAQRESCWRRNSLAEPLIEAWIVFAFELVAIFADRVHVCVISNTISLFKQFF